MTVHDEILGLDFSKYRHSPNILGVFEIIATPLQDTEDAADYILSHLSIDDAEGELLDFLGEVIGVKRPLAQEDDRNLLWLCHDDEVGDDPDGTMSLAPDDESNGGYMTGDDGIASKTNPDTYMSDTDFRELIRTKAATFRKRPTRSNIFNLLLEFGIRAKISSTVSPIVFDPADYDLINYWVRNYVLTKGFRPTARRIHWADDVTPHRGI